MSRRKQTDKQIFWPRNFWAGDICVWQRVEETSCDIVKVVSAKRGSVPEGCVPVVYAYTSGTNKRVRKKVIYVPAKELSINWDTLKRYRGSTQLCGSWALDFVAGDPLIVNKQNARVTSDWPQNVPLGQVPYCFENNPRQNYYAPADDLTRR